ncbi:MAG: hypothetical protein IKO52_06130 [Clostridia bacterium]|nr:hypothetical protein [Clostridia bacterium]
MKRGIALLLVVLLLTAAASAIAEDYTLAEKFYQQAVKESAYRGTVTLSVSGTGTAAIDAATWTLLKSLAPRLSLSVEHATTPYKDEGQATLTLTLDGKTSSKFTYLYDEKLMAFSGTFLGGDSAYYSAARDWNLTELLEGLLSNDTAWPPVWQMILAVENASEEWKNRAQSRISVYETKLGLWMNGYAKYSTGRDGDTMYSQLACTIPAQTVKAEIKQLMVDFYNDAELLTLLREVVSAREAAAYLQPSMMNALFSMLDSLQLSGDVEVVRRYDATGNALLDRVSLPFAGSSTLTALTVTCAYQDGGQNWQFAGNLNNGAEFDVSCLITEETIFTGSARLTIPEDESSGFVVSDQAARTTVAFDYNLIWEPGEDVYALATDRFSRDIKGSLLIRPKEGKLPEQSLTLEMNMSSGSSKRSATQLNGTLTWRDLDSGASISAILTSRTVAPFAYTTPSTLTGAMRIDLVSADTLAAVVQNWVQRAQSYFASLALGGMSFTSPIATVQPR